MDQNAFTVSVRRHGHHLTVRSVRFPARLLLVGGGLFLALLFGWRCGDWKHNIPVGPSTVRTGMVFVQGGTFQMGNTSGNGDEQPGHGVTLSSFYIDKYEVTVAQYRAFCTATGRNSLSSPPFWGWNDNDPIVFVSWYDATAYAAWAGKRLPTEAEWEYAARGGKLSHGYIFAGSNSLDSVAWGANNGSKPHMGGTKSPNELGVYDMSGNVWEWVYDWYAPYPSAAVTNPSGPVSGTIRVLRGGCWYYFAGACSVTFRGYLAGDPTSTDHGVGFRCAQDY